MTDEEKIRTVLNYKHDVGNRIIACIREPYLNLMDCVSEEYKLKRSNLFEQLEKNVAQIVNFFSQKWDNSQQKSEVVERIIRENLQALKDIIEPLIDEVLLFFEEQCLLQKKRLFSEKK